MYVRLSVYIHVATRELLNGSSKEPILENFTENSRVRNLLGQTLISAETTAQEAQYRSR